MQDLKAQFEKLRADAAECALVRDLATDTKKRDLFARLAEHLAVLAQEVERALEKTANSLDGTVQSNGGARMSPDALPITRKAWPKDACAGLCRG